LKVISTAEVSKKMKCNEALLLDEIHEKALIKNELELYR
jgi:hypothetical protein